MAAIMVLGPSLWQRRNAARPIADLPLETRRRLGRLARQNGGDAVLLEDERQGPGERHFEFFLRTIDEREVRTFVVYWPLGARLHGLEMELGHMLTRIHEHRLAPEDVYLLVERRVLGISADTLAWNEPGNRTRYHADLIALGCRIRRWSSAPALWAHMGSICLEHDERHGRA